ncbi:hypothetical protein Tco_0896406 [Tanacetum coccineum]
MHMTPNCDDLSSAKMVLMANLSSSDPEVLSKYSEQTHVDDFEDNEIHNGSNIIPYSQYLQETQDAVIQDTNPSAPNDLLVLSLVEQMTDQVIEQLMVRSDMDLKMAKTCYHSHYWYQRHGYREHGQNLNYNHISFLAIKVLRATAFRISITMSSPNHSTFDIEDTFSSMNILNYTSVSSDYFSASSESSSFNSSENFNIIPLVISPFYNNPCLKDVQAFYNKESPIPPLDPITPPAILTPSLIFEIGKGSSKIHWKHHENQIEDILNYFEELSFLRIGKMEEDNKLKTELKRVRSQIIKLQRKQLGQRDKIAFVHFRISDLEQIIEENQARHQTDQDDL